MKEMPAPTPPRRLTGILRIPNPVKRRSRSIIQASARATGPASRRLSSMPSGVGISRAVSSMRDRIGASLVSLRDVNVAVPGVDRPEDDGNDREHEHDDEDKTQSSRDGGEDGQDDDEQDAERQPHQAVDQERNQVLEAGDKAAAHRFECGKTVEHHQRGSKPERQNNGMARAR